MIFDALDVVVVPFPFSNRPPKKHRPALIVSSMEFNRAHGASVLAMITSVQDDWPSDVEILEWDQAGLHVPCRVRFKLFTLEERLIVRKLGTLVERDRIAVRAELRRIFVREGKLRRLLRHLRSLAFRRGTGRSRTRRIPPRLDPTS